MALLAAAEIGPPVDNQLAIEAQAAGLTPNLLQAAIGEATNGLAVVKVRGAIASAVARREQLAEVTGKLEREAKLEAQRQAEREVEVKAVTDSWAEVREVFKSLSADRVAELQQQVFAEAGEFHRRHWATADPATDRTLQAAIVEQHRADVQKAEVEA